jgi:serine O-acetyltransferase
VVSPGTRIGKNVTLFHGVTIGQRDHIGRDGSRETSYPVLEDQVWVGPHAIIVGGVTIGHGSRVAGGAFVTESVAPRTIVGGNPAMVLKTDAVPDIINPAQV